MEGDSVLTRMLQAVAVPVLGNVCYVFMHGLNRVQVNFYSKKFQYYQQFYLAIIFFYKRY